MAKVWVRTCQECGFKQTTDLPPIGKMTDSYANRKCRKCKSEALDYGKWVKEAEKPVDDGEGK
jgi:hypothetical protein